MAWSAPSTRSTSDVISATNWNELVNDLLWLGRDAPHCRVYNSANISISNTTTTALTFNSERYDTGGMHSTVSNTGRITVPSGGGGVYGIGGSVSFAYNSTGDRRLSIRLNGSTVIAEKTQPTVTIASVNTEMDIYTEYLLSAGDYVELLVYQASGGSLNVAALSNYSPEFYASWRYAS